MTNSLTIQKISPPLVVKALVSQPYGTYIIRYQTQNDELISSIQINNRSTTFHRDYAVLSVRVDETLYKYPVMNYRLSLTGLNGPQSHAELLDQYNSQKNKLEKFTPLKHELTLPTENVTWTVDPKQFVGVNFDEGQFGGKNNNGVCEGIWQRSGQDDIKIFIKRFSKSSNYFDNELSLLKQLCFFPIITLYGQYSDSQNNYLVFSHGGRSLASICPLRARTMQSKMLHIVNIAYQISNAMIYLEKKNIVHRDLTASNVLIDSYGFIRIADFGHAIQKVEGRNNLELSVTNNGDFGFQLRFLAPECIPKLSPNQNRQPTAQDRRKLYASFSSKSDVWSFGILLIQLMLKNPLNPYPHIKHDPDIIQRIAINREIHPQPEGCNLDFYYILQRCWAYEPIDRISFTEIREKMSMLITISR